MTNKENEIRPIGQLKAGDKVFADYVRVKINDKFVFFDRNGESQEKIHTDHELLDDIYEKLKKMFKKQPFVGEMLISICELEKESRDISSLVIGIINDYDPLYEKLFDRDVARHIKNYGFNWKEELSEINKLVEKDSSKIVGVKDFFHGYNGMRSFENLDDKIEEILLTQKAKRLIQKTYSNSYKHLVNKKTLNTFKIFVEKDVSLSEIHSGFSSKLARYKDVDSANEGLSTFVRERSGWTKEIYLEKAKKLGATLVNEEDDKLTLKIHTYQQSEELGSGQWCISYDKGFYSQYRDVNNYMFFNYDFSKDPDEKTSMCGLIVSPVGRVMDGYWRDDTYVESNDDKFEAKDLEMFKSFLPEKYTREDIEEAFLDAMTAIDDDRRRTSFILRHSYELENVGQLTSALKNGLLRKEIGRHELSLLSDIYKNVKVTGNEMPSDILHIKETRNFIKNYIKSSDIIVDDVTNMKNCSELLSKMSTHQDFDLMLEYAKKVETTNFEELLNTQKFDLENKEIQKKVLEVMSVYKESTGRIPLRCDLLNSLYYLKMDEKKDNSEFILNLFKLNDGKIPLRETLRSLNSEMIDGNNSMQKDTIAVRTELLTLSIPCINKLTLRKEFNGKDLTVEYPNVDKQIIKKISSLIEKDESKIKFKMNNI